MIEWVEDQDNVITNEARVLVQENSEQVHVALLALTESESIGVVLGAAPSGLEALRRLVRRWDPLSGGKRRALSRQIFVPDRCKLQDLPAGLEKWDEVVRRYDRSKSSGATTTALDDAIKTAALEALVPGGLEQTQHLAMNRARLITLRADSKRNPSLALETVVSKITSDPMEVDRFGKGGKTGKGDGKNAKKEGQHQNQSPNPNKDVACWHCGKKDIWARNVGRIQRISPAPVELKTKEAKGHRRTTQAREQVRWNKENQLQGRNHNSNQLLRAFWTWRRLKLLSDHRT